MPAKPTVPVARRTVVEVDVAAPAATVWAHVREPHLIRRWFGRDAPGLDAEIRQIFVDLPVVGQHEDGTRALTWPHGHDVLTVHPGGEGPTRVAVTRASHDGLSSYDGVFDPVDEGWITFLHQLRFALEVHPGEDRVSLVSTGMDAGGRDDPLLFRAGLHGVRGTPVGSHVEATRPDGSRVGGTLVLRTEHQIGIHLHGIAESLLVLVEEPAARRPPHGVVNAYLSTYGLDESTLAEARRRWSGWWGAA